MQQPTVAEDRDDWRFRIEQQTHLPVALDGHTFSASGAESDQARVSKLFASRFGEKFDVLGIGPRPAALDVMNPEGIEFLGDPELINYRKIDACALAAIAQGRIVYFDFRFHDYRRKSGETCLR